MRPERLYKGDVWSNNAMSKLKVALPVACWLYCAEFRTSKKNLIKISDKTGFVKFV